MKIQTADFEYAVGLSSQLHPSDLPEVAISGRSNVGKSSLINRVLNRKGLARTSATPGKTATINFYKLDTLRLVDLPGYGYAKVSDAERRRWKELIEGYFDQERDLRLVIQLIDMRHRPTDDDRMMIDYMIAREIPFVVVLTKSDKLNKGERQRALETIHEALAEYEGVYIVPFSSLNGEGVDEVREILVDVCEE